MHPLIRDVQKTQLKKIPEIKPGYTVRVHQKIKEGNKERVQAFEGLVIRVGHGEGPEKTITVRKIVEGIGVEKVFPIYSTNIKKIDVKKKARVRQSKLYYMRKRFGKSARLQEHHVTDQERAEEEAKMEAMIQEAVKAEEKRKKEEAAAQAEEGATETPAEEPTEAPAPETPPAEEPVPEEKPAEETPPPGEKTVEEEKKETQKEESPEEKPAPTPEGEEAEEASEPKPEEKSD